MAIRLAEIELTNFKNVQFGKIRMPSQLNRRDDRENADIVGIYGQNGSGKTAVIDSLSLIKCLMSGNRLPIHTKDYITKNSQNAIIKLIFCIDIDDICYGAEYSISINSQGTLLDSESLKITQLVEGRKKTVDSIIIESNNEYILKPKKRWSKYTAMTNRSRIDIEVERKLCMREYRSVLFSNEIENIIFSDDNEKSLISIIVRRLKVYAQKGLFVVRGDGYAEKDSLEFVLPDLDRISSYAVSLTEPTVMNKNDYLKFKKVITNLNIVMKAIIPDFSVNIKEYGLEIMNDSKEGMRFELLSNRNNLLVPIRYESEGIKKMLSMLNLIIAMYNNDSVCVIIDELDSGIFEFLLGELLSCIEECGKGQMIFTSHNLRPLEMINQEALIFTTTNPDNRYIRIHEKAQNLRNSYLRHIMLGGLNEVIYADTNSFEIANALRLCGRSDDNEQNNSEKGNTVHS